MLQFLAVTIHSSRFAGTSKNKKTMEEKIKVLQEKIDIVVAMLAEPALKDSTVAEAREILLSASADGKAIVNVFDPALRTKPTFDANMGSEPADEGRGLVNDAVDPENVA